MKKRIKISITLALIFLFGFLNITTSQDQTLYIKDEKIQSSDTPCETEPGFSDAGTFNDGSGGTVRHCIKKGEFAEGNQYISFSYFEIGDCSQGTEQGQFADTNNRIVKLCVGKQTAATQDQLLTDVHIEQTCPAGFGKSENPIEVVGGSVVHCVERVGGPLERGEDAPGIKDTTSLPIRQGTCTQHNEEQCINDNNCEPEYREETAPPSIGCTSTPRTINKFVSCKQKVCTPLSALPNLPEKTLIYEDDKNIPISITVKKTGSEFTFSRSSGGTYSTEQLALGQYCKLIGVNFLRGIERYQYQLEIESCSETACTYVPNSLTWNLLDESGKYVWRQGLIDGNPYENCPPVPPATFPCLESGCPNPYPGMCTILALHVQIPVLVGGYCGGWDARILNPGLNTQAEVDACDQRVVDAIEGQEPVCGNSIPETGEECDDGHAGDTYYTENPNDNDGSCVIDDKHSEFSCKDDVCGNGYLNTQTEKCDDGNKQSGDGCSGDCKVECTTYLGAIEIKGGIYNWIPGDIRMVGYSKLAVSTLQVDEGDITILETLTGKMWVHKDLFAAQYESFTKYEPLKGDLVDKSKHFPSKEWGSANSFVIDLTTLIIRKANGQKEMIVKSRYQKWSDSFNKPWDGSRIIITNPTGQFTQTRALNEETNLRAVENAVNALLKLYIQFQDKNLPASLYGVGPNGDKGGGILTDTLVNDWVKKSHLKGIDDSELEEGKRFDKEIKPKVHSSLTGKIQGAKSSYPCKK